MRDKTDNAGSTAAALKRKTATNRQSLSLVSVAEDPALMALLKAGRRQYEADTVWRERNVIPFNRNRVKPPTRPIAPFNGGKAA